MFNLQKILFKNYSNTETCLKSVYSNNIKSIDNSDYLIKCFDKLDDDELISLSIKYFF